MTPLLRNVILFSVNTFLALICMYVQIYIYIYIRMYVHACIRTYICLYLHAYGCRHLHVKVYKQYQDLRRSHGKLHTVIALTCVCLYVCAVLCVCMQEWKEHLMISDNLHTYILCTYTRH